MKPLKGFTLPTVNKQLGQADRFEESFRGHLTNGKSETS
jgi:hypothetical protein